MNHDFINDSPIVATKGRYIEGSNDYLMIYL